MAAVVPDEDRHAGGVGLVHQGLRGRQVVGNGFFDQHRQPGGDALQPVFHMQLVGRGDDDAVRPFRREQRRKVGEPADIMGIGDGPGRRRRVDNRRELGFTRNCWT